MRDWPIQREARIEDIKNDDTFAISVSESLQHHTQQARVLHRRGQSLTEALQVS